jgi:hypothetical protein
VRSKLADELRQIELHNRAGQSFLNWLNSDSQHLALTFDQELALDRRDLAFVTPIHPLALLAMHFWMADTSPLAAPLVIESDAVAPGRYIFICDLWETIAIHSEVQLVSRAWSLDRAEPDDGLAAGLLPLLLQASLPDGAIGVTPPEIDTALHALEEQAHTRHLEAVTELRERNDALVARQLASLNGYFANRLARIRRDIESADNPRILRMRNAEQERAEREHLNRRREIESRRDADIVTHRIATGLLIVKEPSRRAV